MSLILSHITHRKATINDVTAIVSLLLEDEIGQTREQLGQELDHHYTNAFYKIDADPNHYLMVVESSSEIVGTCHIIITPSLTFIGSTRMQIESVRVLEKYRGKRIGEWIINAAIEHARSHGVSIIQLTTNKKRPRVGKFYERLGFEATHEGMKLYLMSNQSIHYTPSS